jgi:hypothetical protein
MPTVVSLTGGAVTKALAHLLNRLLLVSIPSIFEDREARVCRIVGIEASGLWLRGEDLSMKVGDPPDDANADIFVPFTQIMYVREAKVAVANALQSAKASKTPRSVDQLAASKVSVRKSNRRR